MDTSRNEEPLAVRRHVVTGTFVWQIEKNDRNADFERGRSRPHLNRHQFAVGCKIEQLLAVTPPARLTATLHGHLRSEANLGKGLDIDLRGARLVRDVREIHRPSGENRGSVLLNADFRSGRARRSSSGSSQRFWLRPTVVLSWTPRRMNRPSADQS